MSRFIINSCSCTCTTTEFVTLLTSCLTAIKVTTDTWAYFPQKLIFFICCNLISNFINNDIKRCHRLVVELWRFRDMHNTPFFSKILRDDMRDKQVYDMVADDDGIL